VHGHHNRTTIRKRLLKYEVDFRGIRAGRARTTSNYFVAILNLRQAHNIYELSSLMMAESPFLSLHRGDSFVVIPTIVLSDDTEDGAVRGTRIDLTRSREVPRASDSSLGRAVREDMKFLFLIPTILFALAACYFSSDPSDIAQGLWGAFAVCLTILLARANT
jgi:hypothetical protein